MKTRALLLIGAALAMMAIVGCSSSERATAPSNGDTFSLANNSKGSSTRFDNDGSTPIVTNNLVTWSYLEGKYYAEGYCVRLQVSAYDNVELSFRNGPPASIPNGTRVWVKGGFVNSPGPYCRFPKCFAVSYIFPMGLEMVQ